jgi:hypothetical protein
MNGLLLHRPSCEALTSRSDITPEHVSKTIRYPSFEHTLGVSAAQDIGSILPGRQKWNVKV